MTMRRQLLICFHQWIHMIRRHKKRYASLHAQDRKAYLFPNTPRSSVLLPVGTKVCKTLEEFRIKNLRGGFQRRPELISQRILSTTNNGHAGEAQAIKSNKKIERIQYELVVAAMELYENVQFDTKQSKVSPYTGYSSSNKALPLIVDIGCGRGYSLKPLVNMGYSCIGVDLDLSSLQRTQLELLHPPCRIPSKSQWIGMSTQNPGQDLREQNSDLSNKVFAECLHSVRKNGGQHKGHMSQSLQVKSSVADVVRWDLRHGLPFKPNSFYLAISISFLQWLFYTHPNQHLHNFDVHPNQQLHNFFASLESILCPGGCAIIQFYPQNQHQLASAVEHAVPYFNGVIVGDYPHLDRGRKLFLILFKMS